MNAAGPMVILHNILINPVHATRLKMTRLCSLSCRRQSTTTLRSTRIEPRGHGEPPYKIREQAAGNTRIRPSLRELTPTTSARAATASRGVRTTKATNDGGSLDLRSFKILGIVSRYEHLVGAADDQGA